MTEQTRLPEPAADTLDLVTVLGALADPVRLAAVRALAEVTDAYCGQLQIEVDLKISKSTMSHHMRTLREAGLTSTQVVGARRYVSLRRSVLDARFPGLLDAVLKADIGLEHQPVRAIPTPTNH